MKQQHHGLCLKIRLSHPSTATQYQRQCNEHTFCKKSHMGDFLWAGWPKLNSQPITQSDIGSLCTLAHQNKMALSGEYVSCLIDNNNTIYLQRDHTGTFPLYYRLAKNTLHISSDPRQLIDSNTEINKEWVNCWLLSLYPEHISPWKGIEQLPAGHQLKINSKGLRLLRLATPASSSIMTKDIPEAIHQAIKETLNSYPKSQQPWACHLSGGMDSSAIAASLVKNKGHKGLALSYAFSHLPEEDETRLAQLTAQKLNIDWRAIEAEEFAIYQDKSKRPLPFYSWDSLDNELFKHAQDSGAEHFYTGHGGDTLFTGPGPERIAISRWKTSKFRWAGLAYQLASGKFSPSSLLHDLLPDHGYSIFLKLGKMPGKPEWLNDKVFKSEDVYKCLSGTYDAIAPDNGLQAQTWNDSAFCIKRAIHAFNFQSQKNALHAFHPFWSNRMLSLFLSINPQDHRAGSSHLYKMQLRKAFTQQLPKEVIQNAYKPSLTRYYNQSLCSGQNWEQTILDSYLAQKQLISAPKALKQLEKECQNNSSAITISPILDIETWLTTLDS